MEPGAVDDYDGGAGDGSRPVGIGAICDLSSTPRAFSSQNFGVREFVLLESGHRVILHSERGFTVGSKTVPVRELLTEAGVVGDVLNTVLPDDDEDHEPHPWEWLAELARAKGVRITAEELKQLPYEVLLAERVTAWLRQS